MMNKDLAILPIHGMGKTQRDFADDIRDALKKRLGPAAWKHVHWEPVYYQGLLQKAEEDVFSHMRQAAELDWIKLRKFMLFSFADASGLEHGASRPGSVYEKAQKIILDALDNAYQSMGQELKPVIVIAQSLGGQVISNYLWDSQRPAARQGIWRDGNDQGTPKNTPHGKFRRLRTLDCLFTTGCNIPLFVAGHGRANIKPVKTRTGGYKFDWFNMYDEDDILGWPLQPLNTAYKKAVTRDIEVNAGQGVNWLTKAWNPLSHTQYWNDNEVVKRIERRVAAVLNE